VRTIAASYLFLRPAFSHRVIDEVQRLSGASFLTTDWAWRTFADGDGGGRMIRKEERARRFAHLRQLAEQHGIAMHVCTCKNPDLAGAGCQIAGPPAQPCEPETLPLFPD
jgi:hypothetical protein